MGSLYARYGTRQAGVGPAGRTVITRARETPDESHLLGQLVGESRESPPPTSRAWMELDSPKPSSSPSTLFRRLSIDGPADSTAYGRTRRTYEARETTDEQALLAGAAGLPAI